MRLFCLQLESTISAEPEKHLGENFISKRSVGLRSALRELLLRELPPPQDSAPGGGACCVDNPGLAFIETLIGMEDLAVAGLPVVEQGYKYSNLQIRKWQNN